MFLLCYRLYVVRNNELGKFYVSFEYYKMFISVLWRHCDLHDRFCDMYWHRCHLDSHYDLHWILHVLLSLLLRWLRRTGGPPGRKKFKTQQNWLWSSLVCGHYHPAVSIHGTQVSVAKLHETHTLLEYLLFEGSIALKTTKITFHFWHENNPELIFSCAASKGRSDLSSHYGVYMRMVGWLFLSIKCNSEYGHMREMYNSAFNGNGTLMKMVSFQH